MPKVVKIKVPKGPNRYNYVALKTYLYIGGAYDFRITRRENKETGQTLYLVEWYLNGSYSKKKKKPRHRKWEPLGCSFLSPVAYYRSPEEAKAALLDFIDFRMALHENPKS